MDLSSSSDLLELKKYQTLFDRIQFGRKRFEKVLFFKGICLVIESKIVYVAYDGDVQKTDFIARRFLVDFKVTWAETTAEQQNVFLKTAPTSKSHKNKWTETEEPKDEFLVWVGMCKMTLTFEFHRKVEESPKIQIEGTEVFGSAVELERLSVSKLSVAKLTVQTSTVLHLAVPQFRFEENSRVKQIVLFVFYDIKYEADGTKRKASNFKLVSYPLHEAELSFELVLENKLTFSVVLKKIIQNRHLLFRIEVPENSSDVKRFELSLAPDENLPELDYIHTYMSFPLLKVFSGAVVKCSENNNGNGKSDSKQKDTVKSSEKAKSVLLVFIVLFCLAFLIVIVLWVKKIHLIKSKQKLKWTLFRKNNRA